MSTWSNINQLVNYNNICCDYTGQYIVALVGDKCNGTNCTNSFNNNVMFSKDKGTTWKTLIILNCNAASIGNDTYTYKGVAYITLYIILAPSNGKITILTSTDGGSIWTTTYSNSTNNYLYTACNTFGKYMYTINSKGYFYYNLDNGKGDFTEIQKLTDINGVILTESNIKGLTCTRTNSDGNSDGKYVVCIDSSYIYLSSDYGKKNTWSKINVNPYNKLSNIDITTLYRNGSYYTYLLFCYNEGIVFGYYNKSNDINGQTVVKVNFPKVNVPAQYTYSNCIMSSDTSKICFCSCQGHIYYELNSSTAFDKNYSSSIPIETNTALQTKIKYCYLVGDSALLNMYASAFANYIFVTKNGGV